MARPVRYYVAWIQVTHAPREGQRSSYTRLSVRGRFETADAAREAAVAFVPAKGRVCDRHVVAVGDDDHWVVESVRP